MDALPTPTLDKARDNELTSSELGDALRELAKLDRSPDCYRLVCDRSAWKNRWRLEIPSSSGMGLYSADCAEDVLTKAHAATLKLIAEEAA